MLGPIAEQIADNFPATFSTNVLDTLLSFKHEMRGVLSQVHRSIVKLSCIALQNFLTGEPVYLTSKFALEGLTRIAALEGAVCCAHINGCRIKPISQLTCSTVFVGRDETAKKRFLESIPARHAAMPGEVAETIVFIASA